jgi:hypothetical protein
MNDEGPDASGPSCFWCARCLPTARVSPSPEAIRADLCDDELIEHNPRVSRSGKLAMNRNQLEQQTANRAPESPSSHLAPATPRRSLFLSFLSCRRNRLRHRIPDRGNGHEKREHVF